MRSYWIILLNKQYQSVFTHEDLTNSPDKGISPYTSMPNITFTTEGTEKLLTKLNTRKGSGPDLIPIRILVEAAKQKAPILQVIFTQSYESGTLPEDLLSTNIVAISKKKKKKKKEKKLIKHTCKLPACVPNLCHYNTDGTHNFHSIMEHLDVMNIRSLPGINMDFTKNIQQSLN